MDSASGHLESSIFCLGSINSLTVYHSVQLSPNWLALTWATAWLLLNTESSGVLFNSCLSVSGGKNFFSKNTLGFCQLRDDPKGIEVNFGDAPWNLGRVERIDCRDFYF